MKQFWFLTLIALIFILQFTVVASKYCTISGTLSKSFIGDGSNGMSVKLQNSCHGEELQWSWIRVWNGGYASFGKKCTNDGEWCAEVANSEETKMYGNIFQCNKVYPFGLNLQRCGADGDVVYFCGWATWNWC